MGLKCVRVWLMLISMFISLQGWRIQGCLEQERYALLQLKHFFNDPNRVQNWVEGGNSNCCGWESVYCNFTSGRVYYLNLSYVRTQELGEWYLNVSLFSSFQELETLYLSGNLIAGCVENEGFERLSHLNNLVDLDLSYNMFNDSHVLSALSQHSSLKYLMIDYNQFRELNHFNVSKLNNLEYLSLSGNKFNNSILSYVSTLSSLRRLDLYDIGLKGTVDIRELDSLSNLMYLFMGGNEIKQVVLSKGDEMSFKKLTRLVLRNLSISDGGSLLQTLGLFPSLDSVQFYCNNFSGAVNTHELHNFTNVGDFGFFESTFHISFLRSIGSFTSLNCLIMDGCEVSGVLIDEELPLFKNLTVLMINGTVFHNNFLQMIGGITSLQHIEISKSDLNVSDTLFDQGICKMLHLQDLHISDNGLRGTLPWCLANLTSLQELDISINSFHGHIPTEIGTYLPKLQYLNTSRNALCGSIPSSIGDMKFLEFLDLSNNLLTGGIHEHLAMGCISLKLLVLSNNSLQGQIFPANFNLKKLLYLQLDSNHFTGKIPDSLSNCSLQGLYISDNHLVGTLPRWLGNQSSLREMIMPKNHLEGLIPLEFCQLNSLEVLDLSENNITGSLPFCFPPSSIKQVHLSKNKLHGQLNDGLSSSYSLKTLDIGHNHFENNIPDWIGSLSKLTYLILSNNNFQGEVPIRLCELSQLRLIDLSHNKLSGHIPHCLNIGIHIVASHFPPSYEVYLQYEEFAIPFYDVYHDKVHGEEETVVFTTKNISYSYQGRILTYMSGIDLSCNKFVGVIPYQIGNLVGIHSLNLSHNNLTGRIPSMFSNLKQIESLDLSYNNLIGKIPPQLVELNNLAVFSVAQNNLSGKTPDRIAQFGTFEEGSYEGNPFLCGEPLPINCYAIESRPKDSSITGEDNNFIDMNIFYISFVVSYIIVLLAIVAVLFINPYWRHRWFYIVELWIASYYYFVADHLYK